MAGVDKDSDLIHAMAVTAGNGMDQSWVFIYIYSDLPRHGTSCQRTTGSLYGSDASLDLSCPPCFWSLDTIVPKPSKTISTTDFSTTKDQEAKGHEDFALPH